MKGKAFWMAAIVGCLMLLFMVSCGGDDSSEDGTDDGLGPFDPCNTNDECASGLCWTSDSGRFCSLNCTADAECVAAYPGSCCQMIEGSTSGICMSPAACSGENGKEPGVEGYCTPDEKKCVGLDVQSCNAKGTDFDFYRTCTFACVNGECTNEEDGDGGETLCTPDTLQCKDENTVEKCSADGSSFEIWQDCSETGQTCEAGQCTGEVLGDPCNVDDENSCPDTAEYCLSDYAGSKEGHCAPYCDLDGVYCRLGWGCPHGKCEPIEGFCKSIGDCETSEYCDKQNVVDEEGNIVEAEGGLCSKYCFEAGERCPEQYKCVEDPNEVDTYGKCVLKDPSCEVCNSDMECNNGVGYYCNIPATQNSGCCNALCYTDDDCISGLRCNDDGHCVVGDGAGDCGGPCPAGYICDPAYNQCVLNCPACPQNQCCDADSAPNCYPCACENPLVCGLLMPPCCFGFHCDLLAWGVEGLCIPD